MLFEGGGEKGKGERGALEHTTLRLCFYESSLFGFAVI